MKKTQLTFELTQTLSTLLFLFQKSTTSKVEVEYTIG